MTTKTAFVFPGQGSQKIGMLSDLAEHKAIIRKTFSEASEVLGYDLWLLAQNGPDSELNMTEKTQPLLLASSVAIWRAWQADGGVNPSVMAGHSLGEWSALVCAGVVSFTDAIELVRMRGQFMQSAVPVGEGSMAAIIGLDDDKIRTACDAASQGQVVCPVNYNSPGQVVIAGTAAAVERAMTGCKEAGAKRALPLSVSAPFHTELMRPAAEKLEVLIGDTKFSPPKVPIIHNVTAQSCESIEEIKALMIEQIYSPVRWVECVQSLSTLSVEQVVECGPGKVLCGLIKRIDKQLNTYSTDTTNNFNDTLAAL